MQQCGATTHTCSVLFVAVISLRVWAPTFLPGHQRCRQLVERKFHWRWLRKAQDFHGCWALHMEAQPFASPDGVEPHPPPPPPQRHTATGGTSLECGRRPPRQPAPSPAQVRAPDKRRVSRRPPIFGDPGNGLVLGRINRKSTRTSVHPRWATAGQAGHGCVVLTTDDGSEPDIEQREVWAVDLRGGRSGHCQKEPPNTRCAAERVECSPAKMSRTYKSGMWRNKLRKVSVWGNTGIRG